MEYVITHDKDANLLLVTATGEWEKEKDDALVMEIMKAVGATGVGNILLDISRLEKLDLSTLRLYDRARYLLDLRRETDAISTRVAILHQTGDEQSGDNYRFFENAARTRGLPYRLFDDREEAIHWLTSP
jgi:hypothetical protein